MSYETALEAAGCRIIEFKQYGSYQGEWLAVVSVGGEVGIVEGSYGSCSGCDAFEAEFGWHDDERDDYQRRLSDFGYGYLPPLPFEHYVTQFQERIEKYDWDEECKEMLNDVLEWQAQHS